MSSGYQTRSAIEPEPHGSHFLLQIRDFDRSRRDIDRSGITRFTPGLAHNNTILEDGDVVFLAKGARNFAAVVHDLPSPCLAASYFFVLRPNSKILPNYLVWFLNQSISRQYFLKFATTGAHMPIIRRDVLMEMEIPVPSLATQQRIVEVDALAQRQQVLLAELAEKKQLLATTLCTQVANGQITLN
ncbi:MAG: restriction endonuclease subunit S [Opitutaceae bacterium]